MSSHPRTRRSTMLAALSGAAIAASLLLLPGLAQPDTPSSRPLQPPANPDHREPGQGEGQPDHRPGDRPGDRFGDRTPQTPEQFRARLERRLEDTRFIEQRLEAAIASLDAGTSPDDVMRTLFQPREGDRPGEPRDFDQPWRGGPDQRAPLTPEERDQLNAFIAQHMPRVAVWMAELERDDPRMLDAIRNRMAPQLRELQRMHERDPEGAQVRTDEVVATLGVMRAVRLYRASVNAAAANASTDNPAIAQTRSDLRDALAAQFDARLAASRHEVEALGKRIKSLEADIASQTDNRDAHIDAALDRITSDAQRPATPPPPTP